MTDDPGYCGLDLRPQGGPDLETGPNDPWWKRGVCPRHDQAHDALKAGLLEGSYLKVFGRFGLDIAQGMITGALWDVPAGIVTGDVKRVADGAWCLVSGIPYFVVGGIGGLFLAGQEERETNRQKPFLGPKESD